MSDEYFDEFMAERKLRHDAEARIAQLGAALKLARAYVHNNSGGWCLEGIGSKEVLRRTDILGSESETKVCEICGAPDGPTHGLNCEDTLNRGAKR